MEKNQKEKFQQMENFAIKMPKIDFKCLPIKVKEIVFECNYCTKLFFQKNELRKHIINHMKKKFKCLVCNVGYSRKSYLKEHSLIHTGEKPHSCYYCEKLFTLRCNLVRHVRRHTGEKKFSCDQCDKSFILKKNLIDHQRIHTKERPYSCTVCEQSFSRRSSLTRHIRIHTEEKNFECDICNKKFACKFYVTKHINSVHSRKSRRNVDKKVDYALKKPNTCKSCGQTFENKSLLRKHSIEHKDDYIFLNKTYRLNNISQKDYEMLTTTKLMVVCEKLPISKFY